MAFDIANSLRLQFPDPIGVDQLKRKNALADQGMALEERRADLYGQQVSQQGQQIERNNRIDDQDRQHKALEALGSVSQKLLQMNPAQRRAAAKSAMKVYGSAFELLGIDPSAINIDGADDAMLEQELQALAAYGPQQQAQGGFALSPGQTRFDAQGNPIASVAASPEKPPPKFRRATPAEIAEAGLPAGTVAQVDEATNKMDILNKREGLSAAEQKAIRDAKMRMPRIAATERRVERLGQAVAALAKNKAFDGGPIDARVLQYTKDGREVMAAQSQLVAELTALTRVPGIGSQSDLETRLANLAMPSLEMPPEVNAKSQAELQAFISDLRAAYESLAAGGDGTPEAPAAGGWQIEEVK
jgi:hypothetical protein